MLTTSHKEERSTSPCPVFRCQGSRLTMKCPSLLTDFSCSNIEICGAKVCGADVQHGWVQCIASRFCQSGSY